MRISDWSSDVCSSDLVPNRSEYDPSTAMPQIDGEGALPSAFPVTALAAASIGTAAQALADYMESRNGHRPKLRVDARLGPFWFASALRPPGWGQPKVWDPVKGAYTTRWEQAEGGKECVNKG